MVFFVFFVIKGSPEAHIKKEGERSDWGPVGIFANFAIRLENCLSGRAHSIFVSIQFKGVSCSIPSC